MVRDVTYALCYKIATAKAFPQPCSIPTRSVHHCYHPSIVHHNLPSFLLLTPSTSAVSAFHLVHMYVHLNIKWPTSSNFPLLLHILSSHFKPHHLPVSFSNSAIYSTYLCMEGTFGEYTQPPHERKICQEYLASLLPSYTVSLSPLPSPTGVLFCSRCGL